MRSELKNCRPVRGYCRRHPEIRVHDEGVCRRCRATVGLSIETAAQALAGRPSVRDRRDCPGCKEKLLAQMERERARTV